MSNYPRVSIFNCVSNALEMLKFSSDSILDNAGTDNFDYIIVHWNASNEVIKYLNELKESRSNVHLCEYKTNESVGFVPNLRGMMNAGFDKGFELNDYCGLTNTDQYFGKNWLINLVKHATPETIVNSVHITPKAIGNHVVTANFGLPEYGKFDMNGFNSIYNMLYKDLLETEEDRGGWLNTNTMPYLIPKRFWKLAGPWELTGIRNSTPDRRFFQRCHDNGAIFTMSHSSIVYHYEAVERTADSRPKGTEGMIYED